MRLHDDPKHFLCCGDRYPEQACQESALAVHYVSPDKMLKMHRQSRRAAAGRAELLAKRGCIGQMQRPAELVPIPEHLRKALEGSLHSGKISKSFGPNSAKIRQHSRKNCDFFKCINQKFSTKYLKIESGVQKRCKGVHCVDLGESFPTRIYLENLASIQPLERAWKGCAFSAYGSPR